VEIDPAMAQLTREAVSGYPNVRVLNIDALAGKNRLNPEVVDHLRAGLAVAPDRRLKLVANLPYNVATPLITNLLVHPELRPVLMVVTIQREVAERMVAAPLSEAYGGLSVIVQALADVEIVRTLSPKVFWPRPKVESAVVAITPDPAKRAALEDLPWFHHVVRSVFLHRRKHLRGVLYYAFKERWKDKAEVDELLEALDLSGELRPEALNVEEFRGLASALRTKLGIDEGFPAETHEDAEQRGEAGA
jgi:16S rRNA (adenine1518-N6/adenine1519-N6)-dimethyltransferase